MAQRGGQKTTKKETTQGEEGGVFGFVIRVVVSLLQTRSSHETRSLRSRKSGAGRFFVFFFFSGGVWDLSL